jgi:hypothetical protein
LPQTFADSKLPGGQPEWDSQGLKVDMYYWYHATYAMLLAEGGSSSRWKRWNEALKAALLDTQNKGGTCKDGTWEPIDRWSCEGGAST